MEIEQSLQRILEQQNLITELFYERFLDKHPEIRPFFEGVDLKRQAMLLTMMLMLIERHFQHGYPTTARYLAQLGAQHERKFHIPPDAYPKFRDCLLETLAGFHGQDWSEPLHQQWKHAIELASETMIGAYEHDGHLPPQGVERRSPRTA